MEHERTSTSTHAIMDKVRAMDLYPVVPEEGRFTGSRRLARAMEIAYKALSAPERMAEVSSNNLVAIRPVLEGVGGQKSARSREANGYASAAVLPRQV